MKEKTISIINISLLTESETVQIKLILNEKKTVCRIFNFVFLLIEIFSINRTGIVDLNQKL